MEEHIKPGAVKKYARNKPDNKDNADKRHKEPEVFIIKRKINHYA